MPKTIGRSVAPCATTVRFATMRHSRCRGCPGGRQCEVIGNTLDRAVRSRIVGAEHRRSEQQAHVGQRRKLRNGRPRPVGAAHVSDGAPLAEKPAAEGEALLGENDPGSRTRRGKRRHQPGRSRSDDEHVAEGVGLFVGVGIALDRSATEAGSAPDHRLVDLLPERRRPHERLVVEARREDRRQQSVDGQKIERQRRPAILALRFETVVKLGSRRFRIGFAARARAQLDERVRFFRARRQDAARAVILERSADQTDAVGEKRRGERVAGVARVRDAVEREVERLRAIDQTAILQPR